MGYSEADFAGGVAAAQGLMVKEKARQWAAAQRVKKMCLERTPENEPAFQAALDEVEPAPALWRQISGILPSNELLMDVETRRAGIRRLLRVVERMFRTEWKSEDVDADGGPSKLDQGEVSYAGRAPTWDPLHEICLYLGLAKSKLDALCLQRSGRRAHEMCDCIRVEGLRKTLRDTFRPLLREWLDQLLKKRADLSFLEDYTNAAWRFLKRIRGGGRCETRKKMAFELGMTSRERLDRAVLVCEGVTIEEMEIEVLVRELKALNGEPESVAPGARDEVLKALGKEPEGSQGAGFDEVEDEGREEGDGLDEPGREAV